MKKQSILYFLLLTLLGINSSLALELPKQSRFDSRMQQINYNPLDVTEIKAKDGFVSVLSFAEDEQTLDIAVGFSLGWDVTNSGNNVYIRPKAVQVGDTLIEPTLKEWDTNLFIRTTKRQYSFDLKLLESQAKENSYLVKFSYPSEIAREQAENQARLNQAKADREAKAKTEEINTALNSFTTPRNWDYVMKVGKESREIAPVFTYDDGVRTYIGFSNVASIPAIFYYQGEQEMMSNVTTKQQGQYTVIVVHKTAYRFILRSGNQVVGIINYGFGKNPARQVSTSNSDIIRAVK